MPSPLLHPAPRLFPVAQSFPRLVVCCSSQFCLVHPSSSLCRYCCCCGPPQTADKNNRPWMPTSADKAGAGKAGRKAATAAKAKVVVKPDSAPPPTATAAPPTVPSPAPAASPAPASPVRTPVKAKKEVKRTAGKVQKRKSPATQVPSDDEAGADSWISARVHIDTNGWAPVAQDASIVCGLFQHGVRLVLPPRRAFPR